MTNTTVRVINYIVEKPKRLFFIDGIGALLTTFLLFAVLRNFNEYFGMPTTVLTCLSALAACLCLYSTICFFLLKENWTPFIRAISVANLLYCCLTLGLLLFYFPLLTLVGVVYFFVEIAVICGLVYIELKVAKATKK